MTKSDSKLSLRPLKFKEAVADLLKVKPPEKPTHTKRKKTKEKHTQ